METILSNLTEEYTAPPVNLERANRVRPQHALSQLALAETLGYDNDIDRVELLDLLVDHQGNQDQEPADEFQESTLLYPVPELEIEDVDVPTKQPKSNSIVDVPGKNQSKSSSNRKTAVVGEQLIIDVAKSKRGRRFGVDSVGQYLNEIGRFQLLNVEDEVRLAGEIKQARQAQQRLDNADHNYKPSQVAADLEIVKKGKLAKQEFIQANLRLVVNVAKRYKKKAGYGMEFLDLIQAGNLGLEHSIDKFDAEKGFKFSTYAVNWIQQSIRREINRRSRLIRIKSQKIDEDIFTLKNERERGLSNEQIIQEHPLWDENYIKHLNEVNLTATPTSIDKTFGKDDDNTLGDILSDKLDDYKTIENEILMADFIDTINLLLTEKEQKIIWLRFGLGPTGEILSYAEISEYFGITPQAVQKFYKSIIKKLQAPTNQKVIGHYADLLRDV